jgi:hypothetical protein
MLLVDDHVNCGIFYLKVFDAITVMKQTLDPDTDGEIICREKSRQIGRRTFIDRDSASGNAKGHEAEVEIGGFNSNILRCEEFLNLVKSQMLCGSRVNQRDRRNKQDKNDACRHDNYTQNPSNSHP